MDGYLERKENETPGTRDACPLEGDLSLLESCDPQK